MSVYEGITQRNGIPVNTLYFGLCKCKVPRRLLGLSIPSYARALIVDKAKGTAIRAYPPHCCQCCITSVGVGLGVVIVGVTIVVVGSGSLISCGRAFAHEAIAVRVKRILKVSIVGDNTVSILEIGPL